MLRSTLRTRMFGLVPGLLLAYGLGRALSGEIALYPSFSPGPYLLGMTVVLLATMMAAFLPSVRAARIDPSRALRVE